MDFQVGFEFEFGSKLSLTDLSKKFEEVRGHKLGTYAGRDNANSWKSWTIMNDTSAYPVGKDGCKYSAELVSPPIEYNVAVNELKETLEFLQSIDALTHRDSGLHMNLSFKDKSLNPKVDSLSLIYSLEEDKIRTMFGRQDSTWCRSLRPLFINHAKTLVRQDRRGYLDENDKPKLDKLRDTMRNYYGHAAYSMELHKIFNNLNRPNCQRIEFRMSGGIGYPKRYDELLDTMEKYKAAMIESINPDLEELAKRIAKDIVTTPLSVKRGLHKLGLTID